MALQENLKLFSKEEEIQIHEQTLKLLEEHGILVENEEALDLFKQHGAKINGKIVHIPRKLVEDSLEKCPDKFVYSARNEQKSVVVGEGLLVEPNGGGVFIQGLDGSHNRATMEDFVNIQKIYQACDMVDIVGGVPVEPSDIEPHKRSLYELYETIKNTDKPIYAAECHEKNDAVDQLEMIEIVFGKDFSKSVISHAQCLVSPLCITDIIAHNIIEFAKRKQPIHCISAGQFGVTSPISLIGSVVLTNAEILSLIVLTQITNPGTPVVYSVSTTASSMKTLAWIDGSPEATLIKMGAIQMGNLYNLPTRGLLGSTDSKVIDCQAGYETAQNIMMGVMSGTDLLLLCLGTLNGLMSFSYEKLFIDMEIIDRAARLYKGIDTTELGGIADLIREVEHGGAWSFHSSTFAHCHDMWMPSVSNIETNYEAWVKNGAQGAAEAANAKCKQILEEAPEMMIDSELDKDLKAYLKLKFE